MWIQLDTNIQENILTELGNARFEFEIKECFRVMQYLVAFFGTNAAQWTEKICRHIQALVVSRMKDNPAFNMWKFYNWFIDWIGESRPKEINKEEDNSWYKDCYLITVYIYIIF